MIKIDWDKPLYANFAGSPSIKCFTVGGLENGNRMIGIPNPEKENKGLMLEIDEFGCTVEGRSLISNEE